MSTATPYGSAAALPDGRGLRFGVAVARFNADVTEPLLAGALRGFAACGVAPADVLVVRTPGAVELPLAAQRFLRKPFELAGVVALGCVIRGETTHYDYVCRAATDGILRVMLDESRPVAFGVLTCETREQALRRAGPGDDNKGYEAALTAVEGARFRPEAVR
jgi:6,7-dimethyl-8-ribityllumazine synthase